MIKISVQTGGVEQYCNNNVDAAYKMIKEAGFDAVDANINDVCSYKSIVEKNPFPIFSDTSDKSFLENFKPWKDAAIKYGIDNYQAHAPFPSFIPGDHEPYNDYLLDILKKTVKVCDYINCRTLVVHPFFLRYSEHMDPTTEWNINIERYSALIPEAKKYGVTICLENMFSACNGKIMAACCSDITLACRYVDTLNQIAGQDCFGFCLDTGHLLLLGMNVKHAMMQLGDRIKAFHVHDNNGVSDQHLAPYMGVQDWNEFVDGLKAIKYNKTMSFETYNIFNTVDKELCPDVLKFIAKTGRMFAKRAEE